MTRPLALALLSLACHGSTFTDVTAGKSVSMDPSAWSISYSPGMPDHPAANPAGPGWSLDLPVEHAGSLHYVTTEYRSRVSPLGGTLTLTVRIDRDPGAQVLAMDGGRAAVTPYLEAASSSVEQFNGGQVRWWCQAGRVDLNLPSGSEVAAGCALDPQQWTGVHGERDPAAFAKALARLVSVGVTFGGTFYGHGVNASGRARVAVIDYQISGAEGDR